MNCCTYIRQSNDRQDIHAPVATIDDTPNSQHVRFDRLQSAIAPRVFESVTRKRDEMKKDGETRREKQKKNTKNRHIRDGIECEFFSMEMIKCPSKNGKRTWRTR